MHTHTIFDDGEDDVETMCRAAYEKELCAIGFSAHAPITKKTGIESRWNLKDDLVDEYVEQVLSAKNRWKGKLEVFLGFEVDYIKGLRSAIDSDIKAINPDYLIGSVHYVIPDNGAEIFTVDGSIEEFEKGIKESFNGDAHALMHYYYNAVAEMIALGGFEILGHADLIKKNCRDKNLWPKESEDCRQREIARAAAGLTVEINTGGINRGKIRDTYPSLSFLRLFREHNVPAIITADAHRAADIDGNYEIAIQTISKAGYKEHITLLKKLVEKCIL
jgi:histidinol-phosphatase (PHP family)